MKRRPCPYCVRVACSCGWTGYRRYRSKSVCARCRRSNRLTWTPTYHRLGNICHFIPAYALARLKG